MFLRITKLVLPANINLIMKRVLTLIFAKNLEANSALAEKKNHKGKLQYKTQK